MTRLRLLLAGLLVLVAGAQASLTTTIKVTTFNDDDGTDPSTCSLREAIKAVATVAPYGGCPAGDAFSDNVIQLESGTYQLTAAAGGELTVPAEVKIVGNDSQKEAHDAQLDPMTGTAPRRMRPDYVDSDTAIGATGTYIKAALNNRIFNTTGSLSLKDLVLEGNGTVAGNGGIVYAGNALNLDNVIARNGDVSGGTAAAGNGGAIFLGGDGSSLTLADTTLASNVAANKGGAVAMLCSFGVNPYALHTVSATRSTLRENTSTAGAGAIELCGNSTLIMVASTLARNTSEANSGTVAYVQSANVGVGQMALTFVTAAEQTGHVLAVSGVSSITLTGTLFGRFDSAGAATAVLCYNPNAAVPVPMMTNTSPSSSYNAFDDNSCDPLLPTSGAGTIYIPFPTAIGAVLNPLTQSPATSTPSGPPYGLTDYYLPVTGAPVVDAGDDLSTCTTTDQRDTKRKSGTACDIGSVERLQLTAADDESDSTPNTDREAVVDVLKNDSFGESSTLGPYRFTDNTAASPTVDVTDSAGGRCEWRTSDQAHPSRLVVQNNGVLTNPNVPIVCKYRVTDTSGQYSSEATVSVQIKNAEPHAVKDTYVRPVGTPSISFDPMENDNDDGDGKYGHVDPSDLSSAPDWAEFYPIEIITKPELGVVTGATTGLCPGSSSVPKTCLTPPLHYLANNNMSPFSDSFSYRVYDQEGTASSTATVTILTDAPDPDHGGGAGSFDIVGGLLLSLLGLRRLRRL